MFGKKWDENRNPNPNPELVKQQQEETRKLYQSQNVLQKDIRDLEAKKRQLDLRESRTAEATKCSDMFALWGGLQIERISENSYNITFQPYYKGRRSDTFSVCFQKKDEAGFWSATHHNLPYSIDNFRLSVQEARISTTDELSSFIRCLQQEINLFVWRREQFNEAKSLASSSLRITPSINTRAVHLVFKVDDSLGSGLCKVMVDLKYHSHSYLPHETIFNFVGGDDNSEDEFKGQLATLKLMPLKEAIVAGFSMYSSDLETPKASNIPEEYHSTSSGSSIANKSISQLPGLFDHHVSPPIPNGPTHPRGNYCRPTRGRWSGPIRKEDGRKQVQRQGEMRGEGPLHGSGREHPRGRKRQSRWGEARRSC